MDAREALPSSHSRSGLRRASLHSGTPYLILMPITSSRTGRSRSVSQMVPSLPIASLERRPSTTHCSRWAVKILKERVARGKASEVVSRRLARITTKVAATMPRAVTIDEVSVTNLQGRQESRELAETAVMAALVGLGADVETVIEKEMVVALVSVAAHAIGPLATTITTAQTTIPLETTITKEVATTMVWAKEQAVVVRMSR